MTSLDRWPVGANQYALWDRIRPALAAKPPEWAGDEAGFCDAYRRGMWAQVRSPWTKAASAHH